MYSVGADGSIDVLFQNNREYVQRMKAQDPASPSFGPIGVLVGDAITACVPRPAPRCTVLEVSRL